LLPFRLLALQLFLTLQLMALLILLLLLQCLLLLLLLLLLLILELRLLLLHQEPLLRPLEWRDLTERRRAGGCLLSKALIGGQPGLWVILKRLGSKLCCASPAPNRLEFWAFTLESNASHVVKEVHIRCRWLWKPHT